MAQYANLYMDHINGGVPHRESVLAMSEWMGVPANPQLTHLPGREAHAALSEARTRVAGLLGATPAEILFGGSGTELNNLATKGYLKANSRRGRRILLSAVEHSSVAQSCRRMAEQGYEVEVLPVDGQGRVSAERVADALSVDTVLVCVQLANPEVGALQPIAEIGQTLTEHRAALMVDAVAAAGRIDISVTGLKADLLTIASSTLWGPVGAAALYVRRGVRVQPELDGGVQEDGRRGGAENLPALVGFGRAAALTRQRLSGDNTLLSELSARFAEQISRIPGVILTGPPLAERLPGHVSLLVDGVEGESLLNLLDQAGVSASSGSYCGAKAMKASPILTAMGVPPEQAVSGIVFSFGPENSFAEVDQAAERLQECTDQARSALSQVFS